MAEQDKGIARSARVARKTNETDIALAFQVDGTGVSELQTDVPFLNHMLDLFTKHGQFDLNVVAKGDIEIDDHHTVEDIGICLGQTLREALGDKKGIKRYASVFVPMDEALAQVVIDISNRPHFEYRASILHKLWAVSIAACSRVSVEVCSGSPYHAACYRALRTEHSSHD